VLPASAALMELEAAAGAINSLAASAAAVTVQHRLLGTAAMPHHAEGLVNPKVRALKKGY
jgi:hypothetical protein